MCIRGAIRIHQTYKRVNFMFFIMIFLAIKIGALLVSDFFVPQIWLVFLIFFYQAIIYTACSRYLLLKALSLLG